VTATESAATADRDRFDTRAPRPRVRTATQTTSWAPCYPDVKLGCRETDTLDVVSSTDTELTLRLTATSYTTNMGAGYPNPNAPTVGDTMHLVMRAPGLLKTTILHGFPGWSGGSPYWCGAPISRANVELCGA
jgi:hypothetical protein